MLVCGTIELLLVSNTLMDRPHRPLRTLLSCLLIVALFLLLAVVADQTHQHLLRHGAESKLAAVQSVALRQSEAVAWASQPADEAAYRVMDEYLKLIREGALLTPDGWTAADALSNEPNEFSNREPIILMSMAPDYYWQTRQVNQDWPEFDVAWSQDIGSIDSDFSYQPPRGIHADRVIYEFRLALSDKAQTVGGVRRWKVKGPPQRWATVSQAVAYLAEQSGKMNDANRRNNIIETLAILEKLSKTHGNACAC
jgi:hypothetical protein